MDNERLKAILEGKLGDSISELKELENFCDTVEINPKDCYSVGRIRGVIDTLIVILEMLEEDIII